MTRQVRAKVTKILSFRGYGIPPEERVDLEQTVVTQLWRAVSRPDFEPERFWGFVEIVTSRRCIDWRRARRQEAPLEGVREPKDPRDSPLGRILDEEKARQARFILEQLPPECRELIRLQAAENKSYREIAELLGGSEAALRVQMHRCIKRAQRLLAKTFEG